MKIPYLPLILVMFAVLSCTHRHKEVYTYNGSIITECLSDISKEIIAIPLETTSACKIKNIKQIQCADTYIFILNENEICRFNRFGSFLNKISLGSDKSIRNYTINADDKQIIVLDSLQQLHYYSYNGHKQDQKDLNRSPLWQTLYKVVYHQQSFWAIAENLTADNHFEKWLYKFDPDFDLEQAVKLSNADLGRFYLEGNFTPELSVIDGLIYVYSPLSCKETILQDTLYLVSNNPIKHNLAQSTNKQQPVYTIPIRINRRFMIASYRTNCHEKDNYLFCYDQKIGKAYHLHGFNDDFYKTGLVNDLQALDVYNNQFYFYKSGPEVTESFPERTEEDNPVLFFVTLKS